MKRIFLTSGLVICMACPAFATVDLDASGNADGYTNECVEPVLGVYEADAQNPVQLEAKWTANKSGAIELVSSIYPSNNHSQTALYTGANDDGLTTATPTPVYSVYDTGIYSDSAAQTLITELATDPSKVGYIFNGFYTENGQTQVIDNTGAFTADAKTQIASTGGTATWYAHWTPKQYNVSYNSGLHGSSTANPSVDPVVYTNGLTYDATWTSKTLAENNFAADAGYTFTGWNTAQDGSGTPYTAGASQSAWKTDAALTLYAIYNANQYTITYAHGTAGSRTEGFSGSMSDQTVTFDADTTLTANAFSIPGYTFAGWSVVNPGTNEATSYGNSYNWPHYNMAHGLSLEATWSAKTTTVSYNCGASNANPAVSGSWTAPNGWSGNSQTATYDDNFSHPTGSTVCSLSGYTFDHWNCVSGTTGSTTNGIADDGITGGKWTYDAENVTCTAVWDDNTINVNWYKNDGSEETTPYSVGSCEYDSTLTVPTAPSRNGYQFSGWTVRSND